MGAVKYEESNAWEMPHMFRLLQKDLEALPELFDTTEYWPRLSPSGLMWLKNQYGVPTSMTRRCVASQRWLVFFEVGKDCVFHFREKSDAMLFKLKWWS